MSADVWDVSKMRIETFKASGSGAMNSTLDNAAAVDAGSGVVTIPSTAHGFAVGSQVYISGSTNYDGMHTITAVAANTFNINAAYVEETFDGTETLRVVLEPEGGKIGFALKEIRLHVDAAPSTAANFTITLDSNLGAAWDIVLDTFAMAGVTDIPQVADPPLPFVSGDKLIFGWANADGDTWGLEVKYLRKV